MGIPSYYRQLVASVKGLLCDAPGRIDSFLMDYNCLIYQVLRSMRPYTPSDRIVWEDELIEATCDYTAQLFNIVGAELHQVFIALDGPVPLAKMRQQRMRRFRAVALAAEECALGLREGASWDSNAITPGTAFMERLAGRLRARFPGATISDTTESGEGEHKLMTRLRAQRQVPQRHVIYGLDGDLFVLALLNQQLYNPAAEIFFFREEVDKKKVGQDPEERFVWLNLQRLAAALSADAGAMDRQTWLKEYAVAMCLLGNDFVPQSMAFRIKDDGHGRLLKMLRRLHGGGDQLMAADGSLDRAGWQKLVSWLAAEEDWRLAKAIEKKKQSRRSAPGETAADALRAKINDRPLEWFDEADGLLWSEAEGLKPDWTTTYACIGLNAPPGAEEWFHRVAAHRYLESVQWTFDYYTRGCTDWDWMYEFPAAPLFQYIAKATWPEMAATSAAPPRPQEQLALVLPRESYWLISAGPERQLLAIRPELFPSKWSYNHLGKRHFWECEAHVPMPRLAELRSMVSRLLK